jgi:hypothetical protein
MGPDSNDRWHLPWRVRSTPERLRAVARHPLLFLRYLRDRLSHRWRRLDATRPLAVLTFNPRYLWALNEYLYATVLFFVEAGYTVCFARRLRFGDYLHLRDARRDFGRWIYALPQVKVADTVPPGASIALRVVDAAPAAAPTDAPPDTPPDPRPAAARTVTIDFDSLTTHRAVHAGTARTIFMPYPMYVPLYRLGQHRTLDTYRTTPRTVRFGFIGGADPAHYTRGHDMTAATHTLNRCRILDHIRTTFPKVYTCRSLAGLWKDLDYLPPDELLLATEVRVPEGHWLRALAHFDFFLCPPGVRMPMCHNLIECLAVGSVPITNYSDWLAKPLCHGINALLFDNEQSLTACIESAMSMAPAHIADLRRAAGAYYDRYLSPRAFGAALQAIDGPGWTIRVNAERTALLPADKT